MMHDLALRFETEAAALEVLSAWRGEDGWTTATLTDAGYAHLLVIGPMVTDPGTEEVPPTVDDRWHANVLTPDDATAEALAPHCISPTNRRYGWAV